MQEFTKEQVDEFLKDLYLTVEMPDLKIYAVPVKIIAEDRAKYYAQNDGITYEESLFTDTIPLFDDADEIVDWAINNMNWEDIKEYAILIESEPKVDYESGWIDGTKTILKKKLEV